MFIDYNQRREIVLILQYVENVNYNNPTLMNALEGECLCLREIYKCKQIACSVVVACFVNPLLFILPLLLLVYFFDHVNKPIIFVFGTFYHFKNTISIFVTIFMQFDLLFFRILDALVILYHGKQDYALLI